MSFASTSKILILLQIFGNSFQSSLKLNNTSDEEKLLNMQTNFLIFEMKFKFCLIKEISTAISIDPADTSNVRLSNFAPLSINNLYKALNIILVIFSLSFDVVAE